MRRYAGLLALSRQQLRLLGFRLFRRNHIVVVGLGDVGFRLATTFNDAGARVIVIDRDPRNKDRVAVPELPEMLAGAGFELRRAPRPPEPRREDVWLGTCRAPSEP